MDNDNSDLEKLDKVFPYLHESGKFDLTYSIPHGVEFEESGFSYPVVSKVAGLLTKYGYAIVEDEFPKYSAELTSKGRDAKAAGGHFAYLKQKANKEQQEYDRQHRKDRIDQVDFLMKSWSYKFRYVLYIASFGGLVVSIFTYFKSDKEPIDLSPMKQQIQEVETQIKALDSLRRVDNFKYKN